MILGSPVTGGLVSNGKGSKGCKFEADTCQMLTFDRLGSQTVVVHIGPSLCLDTSDAFRETWGQLLREGARHFILRFAQTRALDSTGLGAVFSLLRKTAALGGCVLFEAPSVAVRLVSRLTGIFKIFPQFPTVDSALVFLERHGPRPKRVPTCGLGVGGAPTAPRVDGV